MEWPAVVGALAAGWQHIKMQLGSINKQLGPGPGPLPGILTLNTHAHEQDYRSEWDSQDEWEE